MGLLKIANILNPAKNGLDSNAHFSIVPCNIFMTFGYL